MTEAPMIWTPLNKSTRPRDIERIYAALLELLQSDLTKDCTASTVYMAMDKLSAKVLHDATVGRSDKEAANILDGFLCAVRGRVEEMRGVRQ